MENDQRILASISRMETALHCLEAVPLNEFQIKSAKTALRTAMTLLRRTKSNTRLENIERELELLKELVKRRGEA